MGGISQFPSAGGGGVKSVQRGVTTTATTVTISEVDTAKSFVEVYGDACSGFVGFGGSPAYGRGVNFPTTWAAREFGAYLANGTELTTTGAVRWEVVEFN